MAQVPARLRGAAPGQPDRQPMLAEVEGYPMVPPTSGALPAGRVSPALVTRARRP